MALFVCANLIPFYKQLTINSGSIELPLMDSPGSVCFLLWLSKQTCAKINSGNQFGKTAPNDSGGNRDNSRKLKDFQQKWSQTLITVDGMHP